MPCLMSLKLMDPRRGGCDRNRLFRPLHCEILAAVLSSSQLSRRSRNAPCLSPPGVNLQSTRHSYLSTPDAPTPRCRTRGGSGTRVPSQLRSRRVTRRQSGSIYRSFRFLTYPFSHVTNRICAPQSPVKISLLCSRTNRPFSYSPPRPIAVVAPPIQFSMFIYLLRLECA
jgi:hypothetical protein